VNRQIDTDHKRLIPASAETNTIHTKGGMKPGITSKNTEPARNNAFKVVMRNTPHPTTEVILGQVKQRRSFGGADPSG
jgi:hypothetical protein